MERTRRRTHFLVGLVAAIKRGVEMAHAGKVVRHEPGHFSALAAELGPNEED